MLRAARNRLLVMALGALVALERRAPRRRRAPPTAAA